MGIYAPVGRTQEPQTQTLSCLIYGLFQKGRVLAQDAVAIHVRDLDSVPSVAFEAQEAGFGRLVDKNHRALRGHGACREHDKKCHGTLRHWYVLVCARFFGIRSIDWWAVQGLNL